MLKTVAALFAFVFTLGVSYANTFGNDRSDVWWDASESGWGAMMVQEQGIIFMTLYIYGADRLPTWYSATLIFDSPSQTYSGNLIASTGPAHTGAFDPNSVTRTVVGSVRLVAVDWDHATLTYNVGTQVVTKSLERLTWAQNQLAGSYYGGLVGTATNCTSVGLNGYFTSLSDLTITQNGNQIAVAGNFQNNRGGTASCAFIGTYAQNGRMGNASGSYTCNTGEHGTFTLTRLEATIDGVLAAASFNSNVCHFDGRFGAIKK